MANYAAALGKMAAEKAVETAQGFVRGAKGAVMAEMPAFAAASGFASSMRRYANQKESQTQNQSEVVKEQRANNVISLEMVRQLRSMNAAITAQTRLAANADKRANAAAQFAEEAEREKVLRDEKLLDAIKKINSGGNGAVIKNGGDSGFVGALKDILKDAFEKLLLGALGKKVLDKIPLPGSGGAAGGRTPPQSPGRTPPVPGAPEVPGGRTPPRTPTGPTGGGILGALGSIAKILGWASLAIGAILELPGFIKDIKEWWKGPKWGGWDEPADEMDKPIWERNKKNVTPSDSSLGLLGMNTDLPKRTSMFNNASSNRLTVRNNNPGALRNPGGKGFQKFDTPEQGMRALEHQLKLYITGKSAAAGYKILNTIEKIIPVYAPASDNNNVQRYIQNVCSWTGFKPDKVLTVNDIPVLAKAITQMEGSTEAMQYFYPDNRGSGQRYGGGPSGGGGGGPTLSPVAKSVSAIVPVSITDTGDETSRLAARYAKPVSSASGTNIQDLHAWEEGEKLTKQLYDNIDRIAKNTGKTAKGVEELPENLGVGRGSAASVAASGIQKRAIVDPVQRYYNDRMNSLANQFESTTNRLINTSITRALFPGGKIIGINRQQADRPGFLGDEIIKNYNLQKRLTPTMNKIFGKQFGGQYASMFSQAGGLLLDKGANAIGSMLGFDKNSPYSFGQVAGNLLAKGKQGAAQRKLGREQLIYSLTGIPTGSSSGLTFAQNAQKMFPGLFGNLGVGATPQQQISGLTNTLMAQFGLKSGTNIMGSQGLLGSMMGMIPGGGSSFANEMNKPSTIYNQRLTTEQANAIEAQKAMFTDLGEEAAKTQSSFFGALSGTFEGVGSGLARTFAMVGQGISGSFGLVGQGLGTIFQQGLSALIQIFTGQGGGTGGGGGISLGNLFGGGSGGGTFMDSLFSAAGNIGTMYLGNKLWNMTGLSKSKNPLVQLAGNFASNYLIKSGLQIANNMFGGSEITNMLLGKNTSLASYGGDLIRGFTGYGAPTEAALGELGINTALPVGSSYGPATAGSWGAAPITEAASSVAAESAVAASAAAAATDAAMTAAAYAAEAGGVLEVGTAVAAAETGGFFAAVAEGVTLFVEAFSFLGFSDKNMKKNIREIGKLPNGMSVYNYEWKDALKPLMGGDIKTGYIAQNVEKILPDAVNNTPFGKTINPSMIQKSISEARLNIGTDLSPSSLAFNNVQNESNTLRNINQINTGNETPSNPTVVTNSGNDNSSQTTIVNQVVDNDFVRYGAFRTSEMGRLSFG